MPQLTERSGTFSRSAADVGIPLNQIPGTSGPGISVMVFIMAASGLPPGDDDITIQMFPSSKFTEGVDVNGNISVSCTFTVVGTTYIQYNTTGPTNPVNFTNGPDAQAFRAAINTVEAEEIEYTVQILSLDPNDPADWPGPTLTDTIDNLEFSNIQVDEDEDSGQATVEFDWNGNDDIDGFVIEYSEDDITFFVDSVVLFEEGVEHYETLTYTFELPSSYFIRVRTFNYDDESLGDPSPSEELEFPAEGPEVNMTMDGGLDFGGAATIILIGDPSGLYTFTANKRNDTLYERATSEDTVVVAIPRPFFKTGFVP